VVTGLLHRVFHAVLCHWVRPRVRPARAARVCERDVMRRRSQTVRFDAIIRGSPGQAMQNDLDPSFSFQWPGVPRRQCNPQTAQTLHIIDGPAILHQRSFVSAHRQNPRGTIDAQGADSRVLRAIEQVKTARRRVADGHKSPADAARTFQRCGRARVAPSALRMSATGSRRVR